MSGTPPDLAGAIVDLAMGPADLSGCPNVCAGATPFCNPATRNCVGCLVDNDCPSDEICRAFFCHPGCAAGHGSCGDAGSCDVDLGVCRGCIADAECGDPANPICELVSGRCVPCTPQRDICKAGSYCQQPKAGEPACVPGCKSDFDCLGGPDAGVGAACCNHACVDTTASAQNCGGCGMACAMGGACCASACVDEQHDVRNCGGCGRVCPSMNTVPACNAGVCGSAGCLPGFADCDGNPANGCEVNIGSDLANCGMCKNACMVPNASPSCIAGMCGIAACAKGFRNCNGLLADGCEINNNSDPKNCGSCGNACGNVIHALPGCVAGLCAVGMCDAGYGNCDKVAANGCESMLASDPNNCSACGVVCPIGAKNVGATCTMGVCGLGGCQAGWADCNLNPADGCEVHTDNDVNNCGACGTVCGPGKLCKKGVCVFGDYGAGSDGALTVNAKTTINNVATATATGTAGSATVTVSTTNGFAAGQNVLLHQSQGNNAGNWEIASVSTVGKGQLTLAANLKNSYSTAGGDHAQVIQIPQYTDVTINGGGTLTAPGWDGNVGGILAFQASGTVTVTGTIAMDALGFRGTAHQCPAYECTDGTAGESSTGAGAVGSAANGAGGGGGTRGQDCGMGGGGGYGTAGTSGTDGTGGTCAPMPQSGGVGGATIGNQDLTVALLFGAAGGEGGADEDGSFPGFGGAGGGIILIQAAAITVTGSVTTAGQQGGDGDSVSCGAGCGMGGGGGGAGGAVRILSDNATLGTNLVTATGSAGGACTCGGQGTAGAGGNGRIAVKAGMLSGTTNPTYFGG